MALRLSGGLRQKYYSPLRASPSSVRPCRLLPVHSPPRSLCPPGAFPLERYAHTTTRPPMDPSSPVKEGGAVSLSEAAAPPPKTEVACLSKGTRLRGESGQEYLIDDVLDVRKLSPKALRAVYRGSSSDGTRYVIKHVDAGEYDYQKTLQRTVSSTSKIRTLVDAIPDGELFVFPYLSHTLLFDMSKISLTQRKQILNRVLLGLAELHANHILHTGIPCLGSTWVSVSRGLADSSCRYQAHQHYDELQRG